MISGSKYCLSGLENGRKAKGHSFYVSTKKNWALCINCAKADLLREKSFKVDYGRRRLLIFPGKISLNHESLIFKQD